MTTEPTGKKKSGITWKLVLCAMVLAGGAYWGINLRVVAEENLRQRTIEQAIPAVSTIKADAETGVEEIVLPGEAQAWHEAPVFARTNGYLKNWQKDIGAHVKEGDLLAEIDTPEVDAQLHQAEANLATAEANNTIAQSTAKRWQDLFKSHSVSEQETNEKVAAAAADAALVTAAKAELDRLHQLEAFKRITAPFDGLVTARNTDIGALINAGSSNAAGQELFRVAETDKLRIYVRVPENDAGAVKPDLKAKLYFSQYPGRAFDAALTETADAIDPSTRTLLIQLELDNASGELMPGSYAEVHLQLPVNGSFMHIPANTILFRDGVKVAVIENGKTVRLKAIAIGRDYGKYVEVVSGLNPGEVLAINPPDSIEDGEEVKIADTNSDKGGQKP